MMRPRRPLACFLLVALCLAAPALAAALPGSNDAANSGIDNLGIDVTRNAMPPPEVTRPVELQAVGANPLWAIPLSSLAATRNRPLFTPSRRPPAPIVANMPVAAPHPVAPPPPMAEHPNLVLVGTVVAENAGVAVFIVASTHDTVRLRTGEGHLGWILQAVDHRTVTLQKGEQSETLELPRPTAPQGPAQVISTLPSLSLPPPSTSARTAAPAPPNASGGCMPEPVGC
jgi:hypothetical protein